MQGDEAAVWADKAYVGPAMRQRLKAGGIKDRVQREASRVRRLTSREVARNKLIGRVRGRIEGFFGAVKRSYGLGRMRYMGLARNAAATLMVLTAWNRPCRRSGRMTGEVRPNAAQMKNTETSNVLRKNINLPMMPQPRPKVALCKRPAEAGTQWAFARSLGHRFRGDERSIQ